jgi:septum formation protein
MPKPRIFLCYRRNDSMADARNIRDRFMHTGFDHVFMDLPAINPGEKWQERIEDELSAADVVIVVIGKHWLSDYNRRRLWAPDDPVHRELSIALRSEKKIIPTFVEEATMPSAEDLPPDLREIVNYQGKHLTSENWDYDIATLISSVDGSRSDGTKIRPTIVLASKSPRRQQLLRTIGWIEGEDYFSVHASVPPDDSQNVRTVAAAKSLAERMACKKIAWLRDNPNAVSEQLRYNWSASQTVLIGVDTIVFCRDKVLDRPLLKGLELAGPQDLIQARSRAREMLLDERGQTIYVITGLAVAVMGTRQEPTTLVVVTEAKLRDYLETDVVSYIASAEPVDKAGAFGIQDQGVSLFERIEGSYTNIVGLPLREFMNLMQEQYEQTFALPELRSLLVVKESDEISRGAADSSPKALSVVCVGDINYDFVYDKFPQGFFNDIGVRGKTEVKGGIHRSVGGTAVNFAKGAKKAGFAQCYVVGVVGGDALGQQILTELGDLEIVAISDRDPAIKSSVTIILRDEATNEFSLMLTDTHQSLPMTVVNMAQTPIEKSDVVYCSGYCLTDDNRHDNAIAILRDAKRSGCLVVLDVVVNMTKDIPSVRLDRSLRQDEIHPLVDVLVADMPEIFDWFHVETGGCSELDAWSQHQNLLISALRERFPVTILRTRNYTHELVVTPDRVDGPHPLDYGRLPSTSKTGYGHVRAAKQVHSFLSPRIVLASKSPQRRELLQQIVAPSKIEVIASRCPEELRQGESPEERVKRVALEKAEWVLSHGEFHDDIELIIGADTEVVRQNARGQWEMIGHSSTAARARRDLGRLNNGDHYAFTGLAVIGRSPGAEPGPLKKHVVCEKTRVTFVDASQELLEVYANTGEPIGRAGAYAIQGVGTMLIKSIDGSYSNVVGLPLERLSQVMADEFGKPIWHFDKVSHWTFPDSIKGWH